MKTSFSIFTDASLNQKTNTGFGAYLILLNNEIENFSSEEMNHKVKLEKFFESSISKLEIKILIYALTELKNKFEDTDFYPLITVYTDSQGITELNKRRQKLESSAFLSRNTKKELNNTALYKEFFVLQDKLNFKIIKVKGHSKTVEKSNIEKIFTLVDRASRKALRDII